MKGLLILIVCIALGYYLYDKYWDIPEEVIAVEEVIVVEAPPVIVSPRIKDAETSVNRYLKNGDWGNALRVWEIIKQQNLNPKEQQLVSNLPHKINQEIDREISNQIQSLENARKNINSNHRDSKIKIQDINSRITSLQNTRNGAKQRLTKMKDKNMLNKLHRNKDKWIVLAWGHT